LVIGKQDRDLSLSLFELLRRDKNHKHCLFISVIYLILYHAIFVFFAWTYWKSIFTLPQQPNQKVRILVTSQRLRTEESREVNKAIREQKEKQITFYYKGKLGNFF
jgi:hypothetical protein